MNDIFGESSNFKPEFTNPMLAGIVDNEIIASSFNIIKFKSTATFAKTSDETYPIVNRDEKLQLHNNKGENNTDNTHQDWDGVAVELVSVAGYRFLLQGKNALSGKAYVWNKNS